IIAKTEEVFALLLLVLPRGLRVGADETNHRYEEGDHVPLPLKAKRLEELATEIKKQKEGSKEKQITDEDTKGKKVLDSNDEIGAEGSSVLPRGDMESGVSSQENLDELLAASLAAEEEMEINKNVLTSEGGLDEAEDDTDENEEMIFCSGIGIVNAIEVIQAFSKEDGLQKFRQWVESPDPAIFGKLDSGSHSNRSLKENNNGADAIKRSSQEDASEESISRGHDDEKPTGNEAIKDIFIDKHDSHNQAGIVYNGGLVPLLKLLDSKNRCLQHNAAFALYGIAENEDNVSDFIKAGGVQKLQDGEFIIQATKDCVAKTTKRLEEHGVPCLLPLQVLKHLLYLMRVGEKAVQRRIALALAHLCSLENQRTIFIDDNGPVYLGEQYVNSSTLSYITFLVEGCKCFYAHRIALLTSSDAFRAMFDGGYGVRELMCQSCLFFFRIRP
ncbi:unnamed protein product, partial [Musa hybrid cultivar]